MLNSAPYPQSATAYLTNSLGPGTFAINQIAQTMFSANSDNAASLDTIVLFQGLDLVAGENYFVTIDGHLLSPLWLLTWPGSMGPAQGLAASTYTDGAIQANFAAPYSPASSFGQISPGVSITVTCQRRCKNPHSAGRKIPHPDKG
jgi:hypothetical protein